MITNLPVGTLELSIQNPSPEQILLYIVHRLCRVFYYCNVKSIQYLKKKAKTQLSEALVSENLLLTELFLVPTSSIHLSGHHLTV